MNESGGPTWDSYHEESRNVWERIGNIEGRLASFATKDEVAERHSKLQATFYNALLAALFAGMALLGGVLGRLIQVAID
ncbi:MAG: hypothetical protein OXG95_00250 [Chloroflexi bacterium]|nr:hypothetical protein [Chloroflexota bacterium]